MIDSDPTSGSSFPEENGNDLLRECAGKCGKKILFFGLSADADWKDAIDGAFCLDCRAKLLKKK